MTRLALIAILCIGCTEAPAPHTRTIADDIRGELSPSEAVVVDRMRAMRDGDVLVLRRGEISWGIEAR